MVPLPVLACPSHMQLTKYADFSMEIYFSAGGSIIRLPCGSVTGTAVLVNGQSIVLLAVGPLDRSRACARFASAPPNGRKL